MSAAGSPSTSAPKGRYETLTRYLKAVTHHCDACEHETMHDVWVDTGAVEGRAVCTACGTTVDSTEVTA